MNSSQLPKHKFLMSIADFRASHSLSVGYSQFSGLRIANAAGLRDSSISCWLSNFLRCRVSEGKPSETPNAGNSIPNKTQMTAIVEQSRHNGTDPDSVSDGDFAFVEVCSREGWMRNHERRSLQQGSSTWRLFPNG